MHVRRPLAAGGGPQHGTGRRVARAGGDHRRPADRVGPRLLGGHRGGGGQRPPAAGHPPAGPDRLPRPARRTGGQGRGHGVGAGRLLRLGGRPGGRRRAHGRRGLVPGVGARGGAGPPPAGRARGDLDRLLRAGQGRGPGAVGGQGRPHGAGRADDPARRGLPRLLAAGAGAVDPARTGHGHGRGAVRPGVAGGRGAAPARSPASAPRWPPTPPPLRWRPGRVESRWRAWREGSATRPASGRAGEPLGRWRARRQEALASRTHRARRSARQAGGRPRTAAARGPRRRSGPSRD